RRSLRSPMRISGKEIILTGSIGIAVYDGKQETHQDLLKEAEIAMFRAKRSGSDRVDIFKASMRGSEEGRLPLESELRRAIERKQIKVLYQPITNLEANTLSGFEALVRWDHPKRGRLSPDDFVPIAEETGLISELGSYVLDQALKQAVRWQKALPRAQSPIFVSVNVSSSQLFRRDLLQQIRSILSRDAVPKGTLWLEVTESMVMENPEQAIEIMKLLKELGAGLSLDDFGTGFSSLNYLHRFPVDTIKVDKSFIRDAEREGATPVILRSIVAMSHELGKKVVAEGVESAANADFLRSIGCEFAQGFYFGEPMSDRGAMSLVSTLAKAQKKQNSRRARRAPAKVPAKPAAPAPVAREGAGARRAAAAPLPAPGAPTPRQA
ncbi:MAG TPA: GGDEF domain-containing protein, partial [Rhizobiales bacterium]|nr:GGDEF domain-containing protein [Hyphomicrobiales bacterium]